ASDLKLTATVTDADGDSVTHDLNLGASIFSIKDDGPSAFTPESASIVNLAGNAFEFNIDFEAAAGADGVGNVVFTTVDSTPLVDTNGKVITFDGQAVYLYNKSAGNVIEGRTSDAGENSGDLAFTATLIPGTDTYSIDLEGVLRNNPTFNFSSSSGISGGNDSFYGLGADSGGTDSKDVLVSGNGTVNSSNAQGIGISNNWIGSGEVARFDLVLGLITVSGNFSHGDHYEVGRYVQEIKSVQGNANAKTKFIVTIRTGDNDNDYFGDASDETHNGNITVKVYDGDPDAGGTLKKTYSDTDNDVEVKDVKEGYFVEITSTDAFSIVEYQYTGGNNESPFALGDIRVATGNPLDDFAFELPVQGIDGDGDTVISSLMINLEAELGLAGGHIDVDTYNDTGSTGVNNSDAHEHQFDDTYGRHIDAFDNFGSNLHQINEDIDPTNEDVFRLFVINAHRNPGGEIKINGTRYDVTNYGDGFQGQGTDSQLYTLNSTLATTYDNVELLTSLVTSFDTGSILDGGVRGSVTSDVKSNQLSGVGEWRTGAFSVMAVEVTHSNMAQAGDLIAADGYSVTTSTISVYGQSLDVITAIDTSGSVDGILWETSVFSHWGGPSGKDYGDLTESQWDAATGQNNLPANAPYPGPGDGITAPTLAEIHDFYTQFVDGVVVSNGSDGSDILVGGESIDTLVGGDGGDLLLGGNNGDSLTGGKGNDTMVGGSGNDTFKWQAGETGTDTIADWSTGTDKLDLSELLQGETDITLVNYLEFSYANSETTLTIDVDGSGGDTDQQIVFVGVNLILLGSDNQAIITSLLGTNQLITD
ncbi:MAG: type I secretion C-terminal target domain-containing protein, partial [Gammaproteobacteria bacterium]